MKRFSTGLITGLLIGLLIASATFAFAGDPVKLIINDQIIDCKDTPPQIINGRTYVPARYVAEALGASVAWDAAQNAVVITGQQIGGTPTDLPSTPSTPPSTTKMTDSQIRQKGIVQQSGVWYASGRWIFDKVNSKYPNKIKGFTPSIGQFDMTDGTVIDLPTVVIAQMSFSDITSLLSSGLLLESDLN